MIAKKVLAEQVLRIVYGGDIPEGASVDPRDVYILADQVYAETIDQYITVSGEDVTGEFVSVYDDVKIEHNENRDRLFAELPAQILNIKNGRGLRQVSPVQGEADSFIIQQSGHTSIFSRLEAGSLGGRIGCWLEGSMTAKYGTVLVFNDNMKKSKWEGKNILVKMISAISSMEPDDIIPIPGVLENEFRVKIVNAIREQREKQEDSINDNQD